MNTQEQSSYTTLFSALGSVVSDFTVNIITLTRYTSTPIESEDEVLERAEMMDFLMDMAKHENDIVLVFSNSIADRIEEFENKMEMPSIPVPERINSLMKIKGLTQSDLKEVATQSVISEILKGKREVNLKQAKGFARYFGLPIDKFIPL